MFSACVALDRDDPMIFAKSTIQPDDVSSSEFVGVVPTPLKNYHYPKCPVTNFIVHALWEAHLRGPAR